MAGYSNDDSFGGYSDDQYSTRGYSDDQYSDGGYSDYEQLPGGGYSAGEEQYFNNDEDAFGGYYNPVTATKEYDYGVKHIVPYYEPSGKQTVPYHEPRPREQSSSYQRTAKASYTDKQTGNYIRTTAKDTISTGETFKERGSTGRVGTKNEYTTTKTFRVGDKRGYSEYQVQEKFRRVDYGGKSWKGYYSGGSSKKYLK